MKLTTKLLFHIALTAFVLLFTRQNVFAHWTTKGPYGGSVKVLLVVDTTLYVGTFDGGVYRSTNSQALAWRYANYTGLGSPHINALAASGSSVFAGTANAGVFVTTDLGTSWTAVNSGLSNLHVLSLAVSGTTIIAGTDGGGVFISANGGASWSPSNSGLTNQTVTALSASAGVVFAGTAGGGVFVSLNGGASWTAANTSLTNLEIKSLVVAGTTLFAATGDGVFSANALTLSWASNGLNNVLINGLTTNGTTVYAATSAGVFTSPVSGISWTPANNGYNGSVNAVAVFNNKLVAGTQEDGLFKSNSVSTVNWVKTNTGFNNLKTYALYNDGLLVIVATNKGLYVSRDLAANYMTSNLGLTDSLHITSLAFAGTALYAATEFGGVFMSPDTGKTWTAVNNALPSLSILHLTSNQNHLVAAASNGAVFVAHVDDPGWEWESVTGLPGGIVVTSLAAHGDLFFLGTDGAGVFSSEDPEDWASFGLTNQHVTALVIHQGYVFAATDGSGVFRSDVNSANWSAASSGLPTMHMLSLASNGQNLVAGYRGGVYTSYNEGNSWVPPNILLYLPEYADVHLLSFSPSSTRIFAAAPSNSAYSNSVAELPTAVWDIAAAGGRLLLSPNPSQGQFRVELKNVEANIQGIAVFDQSGRTVQRFVYRDGEQQALLTVDCPPGIYVVSVTTSKGLVTQKLVID